ncbi:hypothetical protein GGS23DRAFT_564907 [Durotheca rogersii]|uniref:uncharacterized protein n=1 Tax=Durotheca rogersii TaxID=419775 RepID=UPI002220826C|nr:uncharacterized protein GGS23DRAFT_564907 [Durotheca rogersii]KAI5863673.1 hypothetical protein GGS23DRAFT_564907 [Durotheca rogersii]
MCHNQQLPASLHSGGASDEEESDSSSEEREPPYTPDELAHVVLEFYKFLTALHIDETALKIPPPGGWPGLTPESCGHHKSDYAIGVLRLLPYIEEDRGFHLHYKSYPIDYSVYKAADFERLQPCGEDIEFWTEEGEIADPADVVCLALGRESYGRTLFLNVRDGEITEDMVRAQTLSQVDVQYYFETLEKAYRTLRLIPCQGRVTIEAWDVAEATDEITEEQVCAQADEWLTDLDVQYLRQLYRRHGWPDSFRGADALNAVHELIKATGPRRGTWESWP